MNIVPIIDKIIFKDDLYYCLNKDEDIILVTNMQEIADMYYAIPSILEKQAEIIEELTSRLTLAVDSYNRVVGSIMRHQSGCVH
jgi:hypothetical protein